VASKLAHIAVDMMHSAACSNTAMMMPDRWNTRRREVGAGVRANRTAWWGQLGEWWSAVGTHKVHSSDRASYS